MKMAVGNVQKPASSAQSQKPAKSQNQREDWNALLKNLTNKHAMDIHNKAKAR